MARSKKRKLQAGKPSGNGVANPLADQSRSQTVGRKRPRVECDIHPYELSISSRGSSLSKESGEVSSPSSSAASPTPHESDNEDEAPSKDAVRTHYINEEQQQPDTVYPTVDMDTATAVSSGNVIHIRDIREPDQRLQFRYFHLSDPNDQVRCLCCGQEGHMEEGCPETRCKHCGREHFARNCPTHKKCSRCRQRGHSKTRCPNRVVSGGGIGDPCELCNLLGHVEAECTKLWTTFNADTEGLRKLPADEMIAACYNCGDTGFHGRGGHLGNDCPHLPGWMKRKMNNITTWTAEHARKFVLQEANEAESVGDRGCTVGGYGAHAYQLSAFDDMRD